jgi:CheY-like chemotaxis protein
MKKFPRILLAEDDPNDVDLTLEALDQYNLANQVDVVHDGEEALDYLYCRGKYRSREKGDPVVILLDLKMPKIDGLEVLRQIKSDPELKVIPVVVLTSSSMESDLVQSYDLGTNAFVVKPVAFHDFIEAVKKIGAFWVLLNELPNKKIE